MACRWGSSAGPSSSANAARFRPGPSACSLSIQSEGTEARRDREWRGPRAGCTCMRGRAGLCRIAASTGPGAAQNAGGHAGGSSGNCGRQFYAEGRVLGSRTRLSCRLPLDTPGRSPRLPHGTPRGLNLRFKAPRDPTGRQMTLALASEQKGLVATQKNVPRWMSKRLR